MGEPVSDSLRTVATQIANQTSPAEKEALSRWIEQLLKIKNYLRV